MSKETLEWLNTHTLIGYTERRGTAWHYRAEEQGDEPNHYPGPIPIEDVRRRLLNWEAVEGTITATALTPDGVITHEDRDRKAIMHSVTGDILGVFRKSYTIHQYDEWLLDTVANILDDDLQIGSAGLLKKGAVAWVSIEVPDTIRTPEGVEHRPHLLACTSHDGSLATTYQRCVTLTVCDNTMDAALSEGRGGDPNARQRYKVRHSRYSYARLAEAREALRIIHTIQEDFEAEVARLTSVKVDPSDWLKVMDALYPLPEDEGRNYTRVQNKRNDLNAMYEYDERCAPWKGTAWGVLQTVNTFNHHKATIKGQTTRPERNMLRALKGQTAASDQNTLDVLAGIGLPVAA